MPSTAPSIISTALPSYSSVMNDGVDRTAASNPTDTHLPLPEGWISQIDPITQHTFYVNTLAKPPQPTWIHPLEQNTLPNIQESEAEQDQDFEAESEATTVSPSLKESSASQYDRKSIFSKLRTRLRRTPGLQEDFGEKKYTQQYFERPQSQGIDFPKEIAQTIQTYAPPPVAEAFRLKEARRSYCAARKEERRAMREARRASKRAYREEQQAIRDESAGGPSDGRRRGCCCSRSKYC